MNVCTRQRRLITERDTTLKALVNDQQSLNEALDFSVAFLDTPNFDDWGAVVSIAHCISLNADRMREIDNELEMVTGLIDTFDSITNRMEELEKQAQEIEL